MIHSVLMYEIVYFMMLYHLITMETALSAPFYRTVQTALVWNTCFDYSTDR